MQMEDRPEITIQLKPADKVLEITGYVLLGLLWVTAIYMYWQLPDMVPNHPDDYIDKRITFLLAILGSLQFFIISNVEDKPHLMNFPLKITPENIERQYVRGMRMIKFIKLALLVFFLSIEYYSYREYTMFNTTLAAWLFPLVLCLAFAPLAYSFIKLDNSHEIL